MKRESTGSLLSTVFVDYDNIYLSLKRKNEEAAKRFAKDAGSWLSEIASGRLMTATNGPALDMPRRIVMNRCYGNSVPRRNSQDNATDMNSFPFVRHHFVRAGFEVIDCPPLTAQLKNSADIRMVMDVRDYLIHDTYFDEFIILSGDADFTPVLHRLRQHARRTVVYANDYTAAPYRAISDGEVREDDLIRFLTGGRVADQVGTDVGQAKGLPSPEMMAQSRKEIVSEVLSAVRAAAQPVPLEALADRAVRTLGHDRTVGLAWGGAGSFRDLLSATLPDDIKLSDAAPYYVYDVNRQAAPAPLRAETRAPQRERPIADESLFAKARDVGPAAVSQPIAQPRLSVEPAPLRAPTAASASPRQAQSQAGKPAPTDGQHAPSAGRQDALSQLSTQPEVFQTQKPAPAHQMRGRDVGGDPFSGRVAVAPEAAPHSGPAQTPTQSAAQRMPDRAAPVPAAAQRLQAPATEPDSSADLQQSIARIHEACQAPPLSPPEYRVLFEVMAEEINGNGLTGAATLVNIAQRAQDLGVEIHRDDARFVLEVVSEADPWFEQGVSPALFASRFRNFVVARCRSQGMTLTANELDLIEAWFSATAAPRTQSAPGRAAPRDAAPAAGMPSAGRQAGHAEYAQQPLQRQAITAEAPVAPTYQAGPVDYPASDGFTDGGDDDDEFPRIVRSRMRG